VDTFLFAVVGVGGEAAGEGVLAILYGRRGIAAIAADLPLE
jgi:hypothetical protein